MGEKQLSAAEAELYDRQIRLWGIESQEKLRAANVLLINIRGLGSEIAKNILLSGINSLTILDDGIVTEEIQLKNFLLNRDTIGKKIAEAVLVKAQALNPLVTITADTDKPASKSTNFYEKFTLVVATGLQSELILKISTICRNKGIKFICGEVFGLFGFSVSDFQEHDYYEDRVQLARKRTHDDKEAKSQQQTTVKIQGKIQYADLNKVLIFPGTKQKSDSVKKSKRRNELFYLMLVLMEFRNKTGRCPAYDKKNDDLLKLKKLKEDVLKLYQVGPEKLKDHLFELIFDEVPPVCSVLGGVIAQEIIKAVSHKEVPINNLFLLNPETFDGKEECVA